VICGLNQAFIFLFPCKPPWKRILAWPIR
jgi:hypothetical protein